METDAELAPPPHRPKFPSSLHAAPPPQARRPQTLSAPSAESLGIDGDPGDTTDLEARIRRQFRFLPNPIKVKVVGDKVLVELPEETPGSRAEAAHLAKKAGERASEGNYGKAIDIYKRVLELHWREAKDSADEDGKFSIDFNAAVRDGAPAKVEVTSRISRTVTDEIESAEEDPGQPRLR